jgi:hypothetical protein
LNFRFEFEGSKVVFDIVSRDGRLAHIERQKGNGHAFTARLQSPSTESVTNGVGVF